MLTDVLVLESDKTGMLHLHKPMHMHVNGGLIYICAFKSRSYTSSNIQYSLHNFQDTTDTSKTPMAHDINAFDLWPPCIIHHNPHWFKHNADPWYCACKKLNSSLILSHDSATVNLKGWPGVCGPCRRNRKMAQKLKMYSHKLALVRSWHDHRLRSQVTRHGWWWMTMETCYAFSHDTTFIIIWHNNTTPESNLEYRDRLPAFLHATADTGFPSNIIIVFTIPCTRRSACSSITRRHSNRRAINLREVTVLHHPWWHKVRPDSRAPRV